MNAWLLLTFFMCLHNLLISKRSVITHTLRAQKFEKCNSGQKNTFVSGNASDAAAIFLIDFSEIFSFFSLISFFCIRVFFVFFASLFFEIRNIYSDTHCETMRVGKWKKIFFTQPISRNKTTFLWPHQIETENGCLLLLVSFTAKIELLFVLRLEKALS